MRIATLRKRAEFQRVRGGGRASTSSFVLEGKARVPSADAQARFGFTVTKKLGGAVVRNRIRRRLKAAIGELVVRMADRQFDYVIVARDAALERPFVELVSDLELAFKRVHAGKSRSGGREKSSENAAPRKS